MWLDLARNAIHSPRVDPSDAPLVSVLIPTWNRSEVLRHAVRSVLWQTYPHLELLVVGDGCTDDSERVVASFCDSRVRWIGLPDNSGSQSAPNNEGLRRALGEYVAYLGHDDVWHPTHLAHLVPAMRRADADVGNTFMENIGPPGSNIRSVSGNEWERSWPPPAVLAHRREAGLAIGGWRDPMQTYGPVDRDFVARLHQAGNRFHTVRAFSVFKFTATLRPNCYTLRSDVEQGTYVRRIQRERTFLGRELAAVALNRLRRRPPQFPAGHSELWDGSAEHAPGDFTNVLRRIKGLPELPRR